MGMIQTFKQAWKIPEMRKKLIFTLIMLIVFRFGSNIPVPGVNKTLLKSMFDANNAGLFGLFDMFTGGSFSQFTIFALGIGPYITASIVIQLLTVAIPALEELAKQGEEGRKKINQITRYVAIGLALIQGIGYTFGLFRNVLTDSSVLAKIVITLVLVAGTAFLMWLGEQIDQKGVGNGISLLIFAGIVSRIPTMISNAFTYLFKGIATTMNTIDANGNLVPVTVYGGPSLPVRLLIGLAVVIFAFDGGHGHSFAGQTLGMDSNVVEHLRGGSRNNPHHRRHKKGARTVRKESRRPQDVRRTEQPHTDEGQPGRRHSGHLRGIPAADPDDSSVFLAEFRLLQLCV